MAGLGVLFLIGLYLLIGYMVVTGIKTKRMKWLAIAILALIPTADAIVGRVYLQHLCATEGGLKVYRVVNGVEGFISNGSADIDVVEKHGYKFSESSPSNGRVDRYSKVDGQVVLEKDVTPKAKFRVRYLSGLQARPYTKDTVTVETFPDGEVLATNVQVGFNGGWAERFLSAFGGGGVSPAWCRYKDLTVLKREIILGTLKP